MGAKDRRARRIDLESTLVLKRIDNGIDEEVTIHIHDISKSGVGFSCEKELELDAVYESYITIWTKEVIHTLLKVVRKKEDGEGCLYGSIFMGLSDIDAYRIEVYDMLEQQKMKENEAEAEAEAKQGTDG